MKADFSAYETASSSQQAEVAPTSVSPSGAAVVPPPLSQSEQQLLSKGFRIVRGGRSSTHRNRIDLVRGVVSRGVGHIVGAPGGGKTLIALDLAMHLVTGRSWLGRRTRRVPVVYMATEDGVGVERRALALAREAGMPDLPDGLVIFDGAFSITDPGAVAALIADLRDRGGDGLLVIDTLANASAGCDENSSKDMTAVLELLAGIHRQTGWTVMTLHHTPKGDSGGKPVARGSGHILGRAEFELGVKKNSTTGEVVLSSGKMKDDRTDYGIAAFTIESLLIDHDIEGQPIRPPLVRFARLLDGHATPEAPTTKAPSDARTETLLAVIGEHVGANGFSEEKVVRHAIYEKLFKDMQPDSRRMAFSRLAKSAIAAGLVIHDSNGRRYSVVPQQRDATSETQQCFADSESHPGRNSATQHPPSLEGVVGVACDERLVRVRIADFDITKIKLTNVKPVLQLAA